MIVNFLEDKEIKQKELTDEEKQDACQTISNMYNSWTGASFQSFVSDADTIIKEINPKKSLVDKDDWKSDLKMNRLSMIAEKFYSFLHEQFFDRIAGFLKIPQDVKEMVYPKAFTIKNKKEIAVSLKDYIVYGEMVASASLTYKSKIVQKTVEELTPEDEIISVGKNFIKVREYDKDCPCLDFLRISPENFCYDPNYIPLTEDFENCGKIVKVWKTKADISSNKSYEISQEELDEFMSNPENVNVMETNDSEYKWSLIKGNQIEVLNYYGDIYIKGKLYRDYIAVVVGRRFLVYFEPRTSKTPRIYYYCGSLRPDYKRAKSPLYNIVDLCRAEEKALNDLNDFVELRKNPPVYAPINFFEDEVIKLRPGAHIPYRVGMQDPNAIIKMTFDAEVIEQYREIVRNLTDTTAMFNKESLKTNVEKTATEIERIAVSDDIFSNRVITDILVAIIMPYLNDCCKCFDFETGDYIRTSYELSNDMANLNNIQILLEKAASYDPSIVNLRSSIDSAFETIGVDPNKYLNDESLSQITSTLAGFDPDIIQQAFQVANKMQVEKNNTIKASKMMGQFQDNEYRKTLRDSYHETGMLPEVINLPNGTNDMITTPVVPVEPNTQVNNKAMDIN